MIEKLEKVLEPFANKLAQQRHLQAISSGNDDATWINRYRIIIFDCCESTN